ncbi:uncharacterized protein LAJ45_08231 [Morchella importuna]|uniref:uncharacterized protein n=1 Tax=Morchella importuna TaxID=1174673 RepID=UPI001E8DD9A2|nr:uncharacterized protein LAJ45_08231 [Morchella importuna]KAH8147765.1 hypothetical protein LAJ45_08231 [Morchella importuna]
MASATTTMSTAESVPENAPMDLSHHFNATSRSRNSNAMKELYKYFMTPGMINLAGGLPYPEYFPFDTLEAKIAPATRFIAESAAKYHSLPPKPSSSIFSLFSSKPAPTELSEVPKTEHFSIPKFSVGHTGLDIATALQYSLAEGLTPLADFIKDFAINHLHGGKIPYASPEIVLTCGNTDGLSKALSLLAERGDNMLVEEYTYPGGLQTAEPLGVGIIPVAVDSQGMLARGKGGLRDVLENWNEWEQGKRPHMMYTVTVGQNPTGGTLSLQRRKDIYKLCEKYDIIIIEDDPYWYLQYTSSSHPPSSAPFKGPDGKYSFMEAMTPSYVTIDKSGRVIRLDTFSKTVAPGCRLGWITAQPAFVERITRIGEASTQAPSGFSQAMVFELLSTWGMDGWIKWLENLRRLYEERMVMMREVLEKHSNAVLHFIEGDSIVVKKTRVYEFDSPDGGMFIWVRVLIESHPAYTEYTSTLGHSKLDMMTNLWSYIAETQLSMPCPGWTFAPNAEIREGKSAERMRFCFAAINENQIREATERWGKGLQDFWGLGAKDIDDWGKRPESVRGGKEGVVSLGWTGGMLGGC